MRTPSINPDRGDRHGLDDEYPGPTNEDDDAALNVRAYRAGCMATLAAFVLFGFALTGLLWWAGFL